MAGRTTPFCKMPLLLAFRRNPHCLPDVLRRKAIQFSLIALY
jgi:hypothetical protein